MGVETAVIAAVGAGLSLLAQSLMKPDLETTSPVRDEKPTPRSTKGTRIPLILGRRIVAPVIAWAGDRSTKTETVGGGGGKGGGGGGATAKITTYYESAIHLLGVGPLRALNRILKNGKPIFDSRITQESDPGGVTKDLGDEGTFTIYWGEADGPKSAYEKEHLGIDSRFPFIARIVWRDKKLARNGFYWPNLTYDVEGAVYDCPLVSSDGYLEEVETFNPDKGFDIVAFSNGDPGECWVEVAGKKKNDFKPEDEVWIEGNAHDDEFLTVAKVTYSKSPSRTRIYFDEDLDDLDSAGKVYAQAKKNTSGVNLVHALWQLQHSPFPHGAGVSDATFDRLSWEQCGALVDTKYTDADDHEEVPGSVILIDGDTFKQKVGAIVQDLGFMQSWNPTSGRWMLVPIREPKPPVPVVPDSCVLPPLPERDTDVDTRPANSLQFEYNDSARKFRIETLEEDDDGQARYTGQKRPRIIKLDTCVDLITATKFKARRSQEELSTGAILRAKLNHEARQFYPGRMLVLPDFDRVLVCLDIQPDTETGACDLTVVENYYGVPVSSLVVENPIGEDEGGETGPSPEEYDAANAVVEVPPPLAPPGQVALAMPRIRSNDGQSASQVWWSFDGTTYNALGPNFFVAAGGALLDALALSGDDVIETGPRFTVLGPDLNIVKDNSGNPKNWYGGQQVLVIGSEFMLLRNVTAVDGEPGVYRLEGIIRAALGSNKQAHAPGAIAYIFPWDSVLVATNPAWQPGLTLYVKSQPTASGGGAGYPLDEIDALQVQLSGTYSVVPAAPTNLENVGGPGFPRDRFRVGDDLHLRWTWRTFDSGQTAAGMQPAGVPVGPTPNPGKFIVEIVDASDVVVHSDETTVESLDIAWADLNGFFGGDLGTAPDDVFTVRIVHEVAGRTSPVASLALEVMA